MPRCAAAVDDSFHALNIDGCPSTNDTVIVAGVGCLRTSRRPPAIWPGHSATCAASLAHQMAADAEGAIRASCGSTCAERADCRASPRRSGGWSPTRRWCGLRSTAAIPTGAGSSVRSAPRTSRSTRGAWRSAYDGVTVAVAGCRRADATRGACGSASAAATSPSRSPSAPDQASAEVLTTDLTPEYVRLQRGALMRPWHVPAGLRPPDRVLMATDTHTRREEVADRQDDGQGADLLRGDAVHQAVPRLDRRHQVRRIGHGRRVAAQHLRRRRRHAALRRASSR